MHFIDWTIVVLLLLTIIGAAIYTKKYTESVSDFLAANRCARRYLLCIAGGMSSLGAISIIAMFEMYYSAGFTAMWWGLMTIPIALVMVLSGWVSYRYRETRVFTLAQFFEVRYSKSFRVFAGILAWVSGIINFGIFPAVGSRFFVHYCGLPEQVPYLGISSYALVMLLLIGISLFFVFLGGQIAVMLTDFIQGMFTNVVLLLILGYILWQFDWAMLINTLQTTAPAGASMINPFKTSKLHDFNFFYFVIGAVGSVYGRMAWQGSQGYACSAKNAHESRMGGILGEWRGMVLMLLLLMLPIVAYVVMHNPAYAPIANEVKLVLDGIDGKTIQQQMTVPIVLSKMLPVGLLGLFCGIMLAAFISTHDTYLHSWGSIFIQDVILPFRKKPFTPKQHIWLLRFSIIFVAIFIFCFSMLFKQNEYILMFFSITGAIFLGGAGACIIGGLYWKRGSTSGAWAALIIGCVMAVGGMILRQTWASTIYPWLDNNPTMLNSLRFVVEGISNHIAAINWQVEPKAFPINSQWIYFFSMILAMAGYIIFSLFDSLVKKQPDFNMDRLLHRGNYAIKGEHEQNVKKPPTGIKAILPSAEFTTSDKVIYYAKLGWTLIWFTVFVIGTIYNLTCNVSDSSWATFWAWQFGITLIIGIITTIWFFIGGIYDVRDMFNTLRNAKREMLDDGMVIDHHNLGEQKYNEK